MVMSDLWFRGHLHDLGRDECLELLSQGAIGRIAYRDAGGLAVLPVNYVMHGDDVVFATSPTGDLGTMLDGAQVSFEIDDYDSFYQTGWSVLVRGRVSRISRDALDNLPEPWVTLDYDTYLHIHPDAISGRRIIPS